jgi:hypothetical protein
MTSGLTAVGYTNISLIEMAAGADSLRHFPLITWHPNKAERIKMSTPYPAPSGPGTFEELQRLVNDMQGWKTGTGHAYDVEEPDILHLCDRQPNTGSPALLIPMAKSR